jgi:hypothetical protein
MKEMERATWYVPIPCALYTKESVVIMI